MTELVTVTVRKPAVSAPNFIIQDGDCYYVTVAVLGYCYHVENMTAAEQAGVDQVAQTFAATNPKIQAVRLAPTASLSAVQSTSPPRLA